MSARAHAVGQLSGLRAQYCWPSCRECTSLILPPLLALSNFLDNVKRVAKTIQGALPIIGLVSRLTADEGGFDELVRISSCGLASEGQSCTAGLCITAVLLMNLMLLMHTPRACRLTQSTAGQ